MAEYALIQPNAPALSGYTLRAAVAIAESSLGKTAINWTASRSIPKLLQVIRDRTFAEEPRSLGTPPVWSEQAIESDTAQERDSNKRVTQDQQADARLSKDEQLVASLEAHDRLEAALHCLGHSGTTLCSTASNARPTVLDYHYAYEHGMVTPTQVADRLIAYLERLNPKFHFLSAWSADDIRQQAAAATERYQQGKSLSVFDGVPFVVKDCLDALPYETSYGTKFMGKLYPATADAPCVATLKGLGAMLLGKSALNEFGALGHGMNTQAGSTLNPQDQTKISGGSSAGSAAAVAAGLCPIAIGTDGGGSARIPSSFCGCVGLKPTKGRLANDHAAHGGYSSVIETSPIANSVADATLLYAVMCNVGYAPGSVPDATTNKQLPNLAAAAAAVAAKMQPVPLRLPKGDLLPLREGSAVTGQYVVEGLQPLKGLRVGVYKPWANDCTPGVQEVFKQSLQRLEQLGATVVEVTLPDLDLAQASYVVTYTSEVAADAAQKGWLNDWSLRGQLNLDTRMFYCNALSFTSADYEQAQRIRTRVWGHFERAFQECDVIMTPATPFVAPHLPEQHNTTGVFDMAGQFAIMRYTAVANLTGLPALVMPGGRQMGMLMPVGIQFIGRPWAESTLLRTAAALEQQLLEDGIPHPMPSLGINPIQCDKGVHPKARELTQKLWAKRYNKK